MRKIWICLLTLSVALAMSCGKSGDGNPGASADPPAKTGSRPDQKAGNTAQNPADVNVDQLNIPDKLKEDIKAGRIPKDRLAEILAQAQGLEGEVVPVSAGLVKRKNLNSYLVLNGVVEPERKVEVFSRLAAYVKEIVKEEGAYVKENDVLALLDDTEIKISYEQARIALEQSKLALEEAEANYTRNKELIKRELISEQEYQTQEAQYKQRQLDYENRQEDFKNLELQLNYTKVRALSEGYITERLIEVGGRVTANQQVYTIEDFKPLLIRVYVPTTDAIKLREGMTAEVTTEVLKGKVFSGLVKLINPRIDVQTGTVKVTIEVYDDTLRLRPGMFVEVRIVIGMKENVLVIPRKAVLYKQNKTFAFVLNGNQASQREINLGLAEEDNVEIMDGLKEGDTIVIVGVDGLKDGQRVDVVK
jgi:membrane fusion protein (multidrug efflux system)